MLIKTTVKIAKVKGEAEQDVTQLVKAKTDIVWPVELDHQVPLTGQQQAFGIIQAPSFYAHTLSRGKQASPALPLRDYLLLGQQGLEYAGQAFPELSDKPLNAMNLLIASSNAYQTWTDPNTSASEISLSSGKVLMSAFDVFEPYFPLLQQYSSHVKVAGLLLSIADSVYMINKEYEYKLK